jgi:putative ABC transport system permease protein
MFKLNLKIALRSLWKNKISSLINVTGLAIGLAACLMLMIYVMYEWNFDKQSKNASNTYITMTNIRDDAGKVMFTFDGTTTALGPLIKSGIPEVKYLSRTSYVNTALIANKENSFKKRGRFAEPDILKIFEYQFISGDPKTAMSQPKSIIITESMAKTLFGTADVLNKTVRYQDQQDLSITGVIKDLPDNTSSRFDFLMPWSFLEMVDQSVKQLNWDNYSFVTMVLLDPAADPSSVNKKLAALIKKNRTITGEQPYFFYPLSKMHLYGKFKDGKNAGGAIEQIWLFVALAFGVLLIACINFMNMATAKSEKRAKEVGIKKTIGATRNSLIFQFLLESLILTFISVVLAIALVEAFLPAMNNLLDIQMDISYFNGYIWLGVLVIMLFTGLTAGSYPAFYLSSFNPIQTLKRNISKSGRFSVSLRQILIVGQFSFTVLLIISTMVIYRQLQFIKNRPLGADASALVEMPQDGTLFEKFELFKTSLLKSGAVSSICQSSVSLVHHSSNFNGLEWPGIGPQERSILFNQVGTTYDFVKTNGLRLVMGRDFSKQFASDSAAVIVSASAVETMKLKKPLGTLLKMNGREATIIGVFEDYIWDSPYKSNTPLVVYFGKNNGGTLTLKLNDKNGIMQSMETVTRIAKQINPVYPVQLSFVSAAYEEMMLKEKKLGVLSNIFGGLAIFISCLGLYGLVAYSAEQRTKEFGVRKVLGASVANLMQLLSVSFLKMILIAILIAVPAAYYAMNKWLQNFEFHTSISWWVIALASVGTLMIAFITLSFQAYKSAVSNPVNALKYE